MTNYVVCLKWGTKYPAEYVNRLYNMVGRNLSLPYHFVCFTDNRSGIDPDVEIRQLPDIGVSGWWNKLWLFSEEFPLNGTVLFLDLDVIVFESLNKFFEYSPGDFCVIRDFTRHQITSWRRFNSSVFRFETGSYTNVYKNFIKNKNSHTVRYPGDQDYLYDSITEYKFWPDEWVMSYKWEMRNKNKLVRTPDGLNFLVDEPPKINIGTSVAVFHGKPNPHECTDSWVQHNWR